MKKDTMVSSSGPKPAAPPAGAGRSAPARSPHRTIEELLFDEAYSFDFFQAVRILRTLDPARSLVGHTGPPASEVARFRAHVSLSFPPSSIYDLERPTAKFPPPAMTVAFMGLTGPSGTLPRHYTELLIRVDKESKSAEKYALRDWIDLFNHRFISLFYRAWEKYRFFIAYERGDYARLEPDPYTLCLFSLIGLGLPPLRKRLTVSSWVPAAEEELGRAQALASVDDLVLLHYSGFLSHRPRCAVNLEALLGDYFQLPVRVLQFQGQWLVLDPDNQTRLGDSLGNCQLGLNVVAGERVWDVQSKFRVRLGPMHFASFTEFLPDRAPQPARKSFFLLAHLVRLYAGAEFDYEVQPVLRAEDVPECQLTDDGGLGPRLGWNTWCRSLPFPKDAEEAVFQGEEINWVNRR